MSQFFMAMHDNPAGLTASFLVRNRILPVLSMLFLCSFLDRTNVGNAKIIGLEKDIHITDHQYDIGLAVYYATYIFRWINGSSSYYLGSREPYSISNKFNSELPSNLVLKKASPKIWLPFLTVVWGIITMCLGFVRNFASFAAVRALLGLAEGGLLPGMVSQLASGKSVFTFYIV